MRERTPNRARPGVALIVVLAVVALMLPVVVVSIALVNQESVSISNEIIESKTRAAAEKAIGNAVTQTKLAKSFPSVETSQAQPQAGIISTTNSDGSGQLRWMIVNNGAGPDGVYGTDDDFWVGPRGDRTFRPGDDPNDPKNYLMDLGFINPHKPTYLVENWAFNNYNNPLTSPLPPGFGEQYPRPFNQFGLLAFENGFPIGFDPRDPAIISLINPGSDTDTVMTRLPGYYPMSEPLVPEVVQGEEGLRLPNPNPAEILDYDRNLLGARAENYKPLVEKLGGGPLGMENLFSYANVSDEAGRLNLNLFVKKLRVWIQEDIDLDYDLQGNPTPDWNDPVNRGTPGDMHWAWIDNPLFPDRDTRRLYYWDENVTDPRGYSTDPADYCGFEPGALIDIDGDPENHPWETIQKVYWQDPNNPDCNWARFAIKSKKMLVNALGITAKQAENLLLALNPSITTLPQEYWGDNAAGITIDPNTNPRLDAPVILPNPGAVTITFSGPTPVSRQIDLTPGSYQGPDNLGPPVATGSTPTLTDDFPLPEPHPFSSLREILNVKGFTEADYRRISDLVTVWSYDTNYIGTGIVDEPPRTEDGQITETDRLNDPRWVIDNRPLFPPTLTTYQREVDRLWEFFQQHLGFKFEKIALPPIDRLGRTPSERAQFTVNPDGTLTDPTTGDTLPYDLNPQLTKDSLLSFYIWKYGLLSSDDYTYDPAAGRPAVADFINQFPGVPAPGTKSSFLPIPLPFVGQVLQFHWLFAELAAGTPKDDPFSGLINRDLDGDGVPDNPNNDVIVPPHDVSSIADLLEVPLYKFDHLSLSAMASPPSGFVCQDIQGADQITVTYLISMSDIIFKDRGEWQPTSVPGALYPNELTAEYEIHFDVDNDGVEDADPILGGIERPDLPNTYVGVLSLNNTGGASPANAAEINDDYRLPLVQLPGSDNIALLVAGGYVDEEPDDGSVDDYNGDGQRFPIDGEQIADKAPNLKAQWTFNLADVPPPNPALAGQAVVVNGRRFYYDAHGNPFISTRIWVVKNPGTPQETRADEIVRVYLQENCDAQIPLRTNILAIRQDLNTFRIISSTAGGVNPTGSFYDPTGAIWFDWDYDASATPNDPPGIDVGVDPPAPPDLDPDGRWPPPPDRGSDNLTNRGFNDPREITLTLNNAANRFVTLRVSNFDPAGPPPPTGEQDSDTVELEILGGGAALVGEVVATRPVVTRGGSQILRIGVYGGGAPYDLVVNVVDPAGVPFPPILRNDVNSNVIDLPLPFDLNRAGTYTVTVNISDSSTPVQNTVVSTTFEVAFGTGGNRRNFQDVPSVTASLDVIPLDPPLKGFRTRALLAGAVGAVQLRWEVTDLQGNTLWQGFDGTFPAPPGALPMVSTDPEPIFQFDSGSGSDGVYIVKLEVIDDASPTGRRSNSNSIIASDSAAVVLFSSTTSPFADQPTAVLVADVPGSANPNNNPGATPPQSPFIAPNNVVPTTPPGPTTPQLINGALGTDFPLSSVMLPPGAELTIYGINFDPVAANNIVTFGGNVTQPASSVGPHPDPGLAALGLQALTVTVPQAARSGFITVSNAGGNSNRVFFMTNFTVAFDLIGSMNPGVQRNLRFELDYQGDGVVDEVIETGALPGFNGQVRNGQGGFTLVHDYSRDGFGNYYATLKVTDLTSGKVAYSRQLIQITDLTPVSTGSPRPEAFGLTAQIESLTNDQFLPAGGLTTAQFRALVDGVSGAALEGLEYVWTLEGRGVVGTGQNLSLALDQSNRARILSLKVVADLATQQVVNTGSERVYYATDATGQNSIQAVDLSDPATVIQITDPGGSEEFTPDVTGDRSVLAYTVSGPTFNIAVANGDGSGEQVLASPFNDTNPTLSSDGSRIYFASDESGIFQIHRMDADGANRQQVTGGPNPKFDPDLSPDDGRLTYVEEIAPGIHHLMVANADGTGVTDLTNLAGIPETTIRRPRFSPDGAQIVFSLGNPGDIWVVNVDGTGLLQLTSGPEDDFGADFNSTGDAVVFTRRVGLTSDLYTVPATGGAASLMPGWPKAGTELNLDVVPAPGEALTTKVVATDTFIIPATEENQTVPPSQLQNGDIYYSREVSPGLSAIFRVDPTTSAETQLTTPPPPGGGGGGGGWNSPQTIYLGQVLNCSIEEIAGRPALAFNTGSSELWFSINSQPDGTGTWASQWISPNISETNPSLTSIQGRPAIAYGYASVVSYTINTLPDGSGTWQNAVVQTGVWPSVVSLAAMSDGHPAVAYGSVFSNQLRFAYSQQPDGLGTWLPLVVDSSGPVTKLSMKVVQGRPAIAYIVNGLSELRYAISSAANGFGVWTIATVVNDPNLDLGSGVSLSIINGLPAITYVSNGQLVFAINSQPDGLGTWTFYNAFNPVISGGVSSESLAEVGGFPGIAATTTPLFNNDLRFITNDQPDGSGTWSSQLVDTGLNTGALPALDVVAGRASICYIETPNFLKFVNAGAGGTFPAGDFDPAVTYNATAFGFTRADGVGSAEIWIGDPADPAGAQVWVGNNGTENWLGDIADNLELITWVSDASGAFEVWVGRLDGSTAFQISAGDVDRESAPSFSPNARRVVWASASGQIMSRAINPLTGEPQGPIETIYSGAQPAFSPVYNQSGTRIYFILDDGGTGLVYSMLPDGSDLRQEQDNAGEVADISIAVAPLEDRFAFLAQRQPTPSRFNASNALLTEQFGGNPPPPFSSGETTVISFPTDVMTRQIDWSGVLLSGGPSNPAAAQVSANLVADAPYFLTNGGGVAEMRMRAYGGAGPLSYFPDVNADGVVDGGGIFPSGGSMLLSFPNPLDQLDDGFIASDPVNAGIYSNDGFFAAIPGALDGLNQPYVARRGTYDGFVAVQEVGAGNYAFEQQYFFVGGRRTGTPGARAGSLNADFFLGPLIGLTTTTYRAEAFVGGGVPPYTWQWTVSKAGFGVLATQNGTGQTVDPLEFNPSRDSGLAPGDQVGDYEVTLDLVDATGQTPPGFPLTRTFNAQLLPLMGQIFVRPPSIAFGQTITVTAVVDGGEPPYDITIDFGDGRVETVTGVQPGSDVLGIGQGAVVEFDHVYDRKGEFIVTLRVEDSAGTVKEDPNPVPLGDTNYSERVFVGDMLPLRISVMATPDSGVGQFDLYANYVVSGGVRNDLGGYSITIQLIDSNGQVVSGPFIRTAPSTFGPDGRPRTRDDLTPGELASVFNTTADLGGAEGLPVRLRVPGPGNYVLQAFVSDGGGEFSYDQTPIFSTGYLAPADYTGLANPRIRTGLDGRPLHAFRIWVDPIYGTDGNGFDPDNINNSVRLMESDLQVLGDLLMTDPNPLSIGYQGATDPLQQPLYHITPLSFGPFRFFTDDFYDTFTIGRININTASKEVLTGLFSMIKRRRAWKVDPVTGQLVRDPENDEYLSLSEAAALAQAVVDYRNAFYSAMKPEIPPETDFAGYKRDSLGVTSLRVDHLPVIGPYLGQAPLGLKEGGDYLDGLLVETPARDDVINAYDHVRASYYNVTHPDATENGAGVYRFYAPSDIAVVREPLPGESEEEYSRYLNSVVGNTLDPKAGSLLAATRADSVDNNANGIPDLLDFNSTYYNNPQTAGFDARYYFTFNALQGELMRQGRNKVGMIYSSALGSTQGDQVAMSFMPNPPFQSITDLWKVLDPAGNPLLIPTTTEDMDVRLGLTTPPSQFLRDLNEDEDNFRVEGGQLRMVDLDGDSIGDYTTDVRVLSGPSVFRYVEIYDRKAGEYRVIANWLDDIAPYITTRSYVFRITGTGSIPNRATTTDLSNGPGALSRNRTLKAIVDVGPWHARRDDPLLRPLSFKFLYLADSADPNTAF